MNCSRIWQSSGLRLSLSLMFVGFLLATTGCGYWRPFGGRWSGEPLANAPAPLGSTVEPWFEKHEEAGESHDFVMYDHEFYEDTARLTRDGEDHLRQIAARLANEPFHVLIEPSQTTPKPGSENEFPTYYNPELDLQRQHVVVRGLTMMGVPNADARVVVAPALAPGYRDFEGQRAYGRGINGGGFGGGMGGGFGGGFGGMGGFGGGFF